jgi:hypothetical protein
MARFPLATRTRRVPNLHIPGACQICIYQCDHICLRGAAGVSQTFAREAYPDRPFHTIKKRPLTSHAAKAKSNCPDQLICLRVASIGLTSRGRHFQARRHTK